MSMERKVPLESALLDGPKETTKWNKVEQRTKNERHDRTSVDRTFRMRNIRLTHIFFLGALFSARFLATELIRRRGNRG